LACHREQQNNARFSRDWADDVMEFDTGSVNARDCDAQTSGRSAREPAPSGSKPTSTVRRRKPNKVATTINPRLRDGNAVEFRFNA
jgi:hypothetical protein